MFILIDVSFVDCFNLKDFVFLFVIMDKQVMNKLFYKRYSLSSG